MNKRFSARGLLAATLTVCLSLVGLGTAGAVIVQIDGGTWYYGTSSNLVWSRYYHNGQKHGSTAIGNYTSDSGCVNRNVWSHASAEKGMFTTGQSYYRHC